MYKEEGLDLRSKTKRKKVSIARVPEKKLVTALNECWAMDFVSDQLYNGKRFRALALIDTYSRECLAIYVDKSIKGVTVVKFLEKLTEETGSPKKIKVDNGPEFISRSLDHGLISTKYSSNTHVLESLQTIRILNLLTAVSGRSV